MATNPFLAMKEEEEKRREQAANPFLWMLEKESGAQADEEMPQDEHILVRAARNVAAGIGDFLSQFAEMARPDEPLPYRPPSEEGAPSALETLIFDPLQPFKFLTSLLVSRVGHQLSGLGTEPVPFRGIESVIDPEYLATSGARALGTSLPLMAAGAGVGAALQGASPLAQALLAGLTMRAMEGSMEADTVFRESLNEGRTPEEATLAAAKTLAANLGLTGVDAAQFALAFLPIGRPAATAIGRALQATGRVAGSVATEAGEEGVQEVIQRWALDRPIALDPQMQEALLLGGLMGGVFGAAGQVTEALAPGTFRAQPASATRPARTTPPPERRPVAEPAPPTVMDEPPSVVAPPEEARPEVSPAPEAVTPVEEPTVTEPVEPAAVPETVTEPPVERPAAPRPEPRPEEPGPVAAPPAPSEPEPSPAPPTEPVVSRPRAPRISAEISDPSGKLRVSLVGRSNSAAMARLEQAGFQWNERGRFWEADPSPERLQLLREWGSVRGFSLGDRVKVQGTPVPATVVALRPKELVVRFDRGGSRAFGDSDIRRGVIRQLDEEPPVTPPTAPETQPAVAPEPPPIPAPESEPPTGIPSLPELGVRSGVGAEPEHLPEATVTAPPTPEAPTPPAEPATTGPTDIPPEPAVSTLGGFAVGDRVQAVLRGRLWVGDVVEATPDSLRVRFDGGREGLFVPGDIDRYQVRRVDQAGEVAPVAPEEGAAAPTPEVETPPTEPAQAAAPHQRVAEFVRERLAAGQTLTADELFRVAAEAYGGTLAEGAFTPKDAYDAMELGINRFLAENPIGDTTGTLPEAIAKLHQIEAEILDRIPTQTRRTEETDEFQQFSTPPNLAFVAARAANIQPGDVVLEPSAGIGGLAVFAKNVGAQVVVNELSPRRAEILRALGFDRVFTENAEHLHAILPSEVRPTVVIMNPPFSATAGRIRGQRKTTNVLRHLDQALKRLEPGGRLVAVVGRGMRPDAPAFRDWWRRVAQEYTVVANIGIDGRNYRRYGTEFDTRLLVIDKTGPTTKPPVTGDFQNLGEVLVELEEVRNVRVPTRSAGVEQTPGQPGVQTVPVADRPDVVSPGGVSIPSPAPSVGADGGEGVSAPSIRPIPGAAPSGLHPGRPVPRPPRPGDEGAAGTRDFPGGAVGGPGDTEVEGGRGGRGAVPGGSGTERDRGSDTAPETGRRLRVSRPDAPVGEEELTESVYVQYRPKKVRIEGAKPHPAPLAESAAMAAVDPPEATYTPDLPPEIVKKGLLSDAQLEAVVYAGQAHSQMLPDGQRRGFFIGDGTGVGKGRTISGIILDNMRQGRKKAVWVSKNMDLLADAQRDWSNIGQDPNMIFPYSKVKAGEVPKQDEGILFTTYSTLGQGSSVTKAGTLEAGREGVTSRLDALVEWLGEDFDGVIAFDEAHEMRSALPVAKGMRKKKPAIKAMAGVELQKRLPNARIVYVSATGATEVENLAYAERLGLWGEGTAFADKRDFINKIGSAGLAALELVARDMKAQGSYIARNLSYEGVTYGTLEHVLTPEQQEMYDVMARAWQVVLQNITKALELTEGKNDAWARASAASQFWSAHQRFFNQIITSMQMPSVIEAIRKDLEEGRAAVLQLVNTNEAAQNRQLADRDPDDPLEDLDLTPRGTLAMFLEKAFPIQQYQKVRDKDGRERWVPVTDSAGNPVVNPEALALRNQMLEELGAIRIPEGPLEILLNTFGTDAVAEVTGRTQRVVRDPKTGKARVEHRTPRHRERDADAFMNDEKRILVFSDAGGTGRSYHADLNHNNQRKRVHYLVQPGWVAENAVQGFGRTHRTNQAQPPHYVLVTTNLLGQKRFISTIARRLDQLGALTRGQRQAGGQGIFSERDNLESPFAALALERFYRELSSGDIEIGIPADELLQKMGLQIVDQYGNVLESPDLRNMPRFLNRVLSLETDLQNRVFAAFMQRFDQVLEQAAADGTLDVGMETYRADSIEVVNERIVHRTDAGADTVYMQVRAGHRITPRTFEEADRILEAARNRGRQAAFFRNTRSGRVYGLIQVGDRTTDSGRVVKTYRRIHPNGVQDYLDDTRAANYQRLSESDAQALWDAEVAKLPEFRYENLHVISGALLPIWDRLPQERARVYRMRTDDGRVILGRVISQQQIGSVLQNLGAGGLDVQGTQLSPAQVIDYILEEGYTARLANGWRIMRRRVAGEERLEIEGNDLFTFADQLKRQGVFTERIAYKTRFFIPTGERAEEVVRAVTANRPIVELVSPSGESMPVTLATPPETVTESAAPGTVEVEAPPSDPKRLPAVVPGDEALADVEARNARRLTERTPDPLNPPPGPGILGISMLRQRPAEFQSPYSFDDPEIESRFQAAQGFPTTPAREKVQEAVKLAFERFSRVFDTLPRTPFFAEALNYLLRFQKQRNVAAERAKNLLDGITADLDPISYDLFRRKVILDDLAEEVVRQLTDQGIVEEGATFAQAVEAVEVPADPSEPGPVAIPFGFDVWRLAREKARIDEAAAENPRVQEALSLRREIWNALKRDYVDWMTRIGLNAESRFTRDFYYRHQVLEYARMKDSLNPGYMRKLRTPTGRAWLKRRAGSELDINTDYLQAEFEVMSQMLFDIEAAKVIKMVDDVYNIASELKREAARRNHAMIQQMALQDAAIADSLKTFRWMIGSGIRELNELAASGQLWQGERGEFAHVVERMAADHEAYLSALEEDIEITPEPIGPPGTPMGPTGREAFRFYSALAESGQPGAAAAAKILKAVSERRTWIATTLGRRFVKWEDLIREREGYTAWQPREGHVFFLTEAIPVKLARSLVDGALKEIGVTEDELNRLVRPLLAVGGKRREFVIPVELAETLDNLFKPRQPNPVMRGLQIAQRGWKQWQLISPTRWFRYNLRNLSSDLDAVFVTQPRIFREVPQAIRDLYHHMILGRPPSEDLAAWIYRGGSLSLLQAQEMGDPKSVEPFHDLYHKMHRPGIAGLMDSAGRLPVRLWHAYWRASRLTTDFREAILRYAAFRYLRNEMRRNPQGRPSSWLASNREEVMAIRDIDDRAYKMANELLVAYDQIGVWGQSLREFIVPFWSWQEGNARRYTQIMKNLAQDARTAEVIGRRFISSVLRLPITSALIAMNVGGFLLKAIALWALLESYNRVRFPHLIPLRPDWLTYAPHLIIGQDDDGNVIYFSNLLGFHDFVNWFGVNEMPAHVRDYLSGKKPLVEIAKEMATAPAKKFIGMIGPVLTAPAEFVGGVRWFPDPTEGRPVRDRWEHLFESFGLGPEYRKLAGLPDRPYEERLRQLLFYRADPNQWAYWNIKEEVAEFARKLGKPDGWSGEGARSRALYYLRTAIRLGDQEAAERYLLEYILAGGTPQGIRSIRNTLHPLYGLNQQEQLAFLAQLDERDVANLQAALLYYYGILAELEAMGL